VHYVELMYEEKVGRTAAILMTFYLRFCMLLHL